jgi:hypothetical protein
MTAAPHRRNRPLRGLVVLAALYSGTIGIFPASAVAAETHEGGPPWAGLAVTVQERLVSPAASQAPYDAQIGLDYVITNVGRVPIYAVGLTDPLVSRRNVDCGRSSPIKVLAPGSSVDCSAPVQLPPGTYASRPHVYGWVQVLVLGLPVTASGKTTFTVSAPPPPSSPPASPSASPTPTPTISSASPSQSPAAPTPSVQAASPVATVAAKSSSAPPSASPSSSSPPPPSVTAAARPTARPVFLPPAPVAQVHRLSTHVAVLLLLLPAGVGAAIAGAAAARRR